MFPRTPFSRLLPNFQIGLFFSFVFQSGVWGVFLVSQARFFLEFGEGFFLLFS